MDVYHNSKIFMEDWRNFCKLLNWMSTRITRTRMHTSILNSWFSLILWFFVCALTNTHAVLDSIFILLSSGYKMRLIQAKLILSSNNFLHILVLFKFVGIIKFHPFSTIVPLLYALKTSKSLIFRCFQGV